MNTLTVFEFDKIIEMHDGVSVTSHAVPARVFTWLQSECLKMNQGAPTWLKLSQAQGQPAIHVANYVGVLRAPCGFQIEILPKIGKNTSPERARRLLIDMLQCLAQFRHIEIAQANLAIIRMPLLEVFIAQFLGAVGSLVKRGLRSDYVAQRDDLFALRGKLLVSKNLSQNLLRKDRFFTEHDEFSQNRAENRLLHSALRCALTICHAQEHQRAARKLCFMFADVPLCADVKRDMARIRLERGMGHYAGALAWAKLILQGMNPISSLGQHLAPSFLFSMEAVFEAYVEKHLARQLHDAYSLKAQASSCHLVEHEAQRWFRLKPDFLVLDEQHRTHLLLDTKWKLLDAAKNNVGEKYQLSQADFYQLYAYGQHYLHGRGDLVLIYPKTDRFAQPLPVFIFPQTAELRLWVLPFCLETRRLILPESSCIQALFSTI